MQALKARAGWILAVSLCLTLAASMARSAELEQRAAPADTIKSDAAQFCANVKDEAKERRYAVKEEELAALIGEIDQKMIELEKKRIELEEWQNRREDFSKRATEGLVEIYAKMRPAVAAEQLEIVATDLSASILMKLSSRQAGVILNEMKTETAAKITNVMAASTRQKDPS